MSQPRPLKWFVISAALFTIIAWAVYLMLQKNNQQTFSVERLLQERATLVKQDMKFVSRGQNFAHYVITAVGERSDTVHCAYRLPANARKLKAVLWLYDSTTDVNLSAILDGFLPAQHAAVIAYNVHRNFERDERGAINPSRANVFNGLSKTRRDVGLLLQVLKKHQVVDSTAIHVGGQGLANGPMIGALADPPLRVQGAGFIDFGAGLRKWAEVDKAEMAASFEMVKRAARANTIIIEPRGAQAFARSDGELRARSVIMDATAGDPEGDKIKAGLRAWLSEVVGADTIDIPMKPDTTFTKVVKTRS